jgi:putative glutamine amidotransferase
MNRYVTAAMAYADAAALLIPALPDLMSASEVISRLDGLLLTGTPSNMQPGLYGPDDPEAAGPFDPGRDTMTADLIRLTLAAGKPVFGICRGLQEINVAFGGSLRRDMSVQGAALPHHSPPEASFEASFDHHHSVALTPGGVLAQAMGATTLEISSVHYQGIGRLGDGLEVEAQAPDGVVEAVHANVGGAPVLAVQWHPEWRAAANPQSQTFFHLLGRALRRQPLVPVSAPSDRQESRV